jgi:hypothetical protein
LIFCGNIVPESTCVQNLAAPYPIGSANNINSDPLFFNNISDFHLQCGSPAINAGKDAAVPGDGFNLLQTTVVGSRPNPDLDTRWRQHGAVDMGVYEQSNLVSWCSGEVNGTCRVNIDDLLAVIAVWGPCPTPPTPCSGDIAPAPCGDGFVDINDLLMVISTWDCTTGSCAEGSPVQLNDAEDCMDAASLQYQPYSPEWVDTVNKCVDALRAAGIIE